MDRMTLREAAERTSRSITTLRRYIRGGRLHAEKRVGRFGPEYFVSSADLIHAGLAPEPLADATNDDNAPAMSLAPRPEGQALVAAPAEAVPLSLYQELQMKHEQLLVQYGMVRAGGLKVMELQAELEAKERELARRAEEISALRSRVGEDTTRLKRELREARLELEQYSTENAALHEKTRALEMLTRNSVTSDSIEKQFRRVMDQRRRIDRLSAVNRGPKAAKPPTTDH